eukprot:CAMPEP_0117503456 /NCGR_PEP_ID=MMETSP0784-20121206/24339_1 /TAXON_ID=39447 /ORGANISM="" /LENGTH=442 /DNA_ID=CAMNT_0005298773 /DNA_START=307 /DNA_END=1631 /DNA_ORIENTATION=+
MEWRKKVGESVAEGEVIAVIETDKVTIDVKADKAGHLEKVLVMADETCEVGQELCILAPGAGSGQTSAAPAAASAAPPTPAAKPAAAAASPTGNPVTVKCPELGGESITEGSIMEWKYKVGDYVKAGDVLVLIETDKVTVEVKAETSGTVSEIILAAEATAEVGVAMCKIVPGPPPAGGAPAAAASPEPTPSAPAAAAPAAAAALAAAAPVATPASAPAGAIAANRGERREKMKRMRLAIAKNLKLSQDTLAMLTTFQEVDMSGVMAFRKEYKELFEQTHGAKLGFMSIFMKASALALQQIPAVNAYIDGKTSEVVYREYVDIGFAAATPRGLVTPVVRNVESLSIKGIEEEFAVLAGKAKKDALSLEEMSGASFTISNGGVFGSMLGTPLIGSLEQSAILGLHATKPRPVVLKSGEIAVRPIMYVALTYDHRLVDGREAVT